MHVMITTFLNNVVVIRLYKLDLKSHCLRKLSRVKRWGSADFLQINTI